MGVTKFADLTRYGQVDLKVCDAANKVLLRNVTDEEHLFETLDQGGLTSVFKTEIIQNLVHHDPQCL